MKTYGEILLMIRKACDNCFSVEAKDIHAEIIESATKIYIKQMELDFEREKARIKNK